MLQTEAALSVILLNTHICSPLQIILRITATVWYLFPYLQSQRMWYFVLQALF